MVNPPEQSKQLNYRNLHFVTNQSYTDMRHQPKYDYEVTDLGLIRREQKRIKIHDPFILSGIKTKQIQMLWPITIETVLYAVRWMAKFQLLAVGCFYALNRTSVYISKIHRIT